MSVQAPRRKPSINDVTNTDIELLIQWGHDISSRALKMADGIYRGKVEAIEEPVHKGLMLLATARSLTDLAARILGKAASAEQVQELQKKAADEAKTKRSKAKRHESA